jgi:hypothetical protein
MRIERGERMTAASMELVAARQRLIADFDAKIRASSTR